MRKLIVSEFVSLDGVMQAPGGKDEDRDGACRARAASGHEVPSTMFGNVPVADFARFQELHVRHHHVQLPGVDPAPARK